MILYIFTYILLYKDAFDLGLGVFRVDTQNLSPFRTQISRRFIIAICCGLLASFLFVFNYFISERMWLDQCDTYFSLDTSFTRIIMIFLCVLLTLTLIRRYEHDFVSIPKLCPPSRNDGSVSTDQSLRDQKLA